MSPGVSVRPLPTLRRRGSGERNKSIASQEEDGEIKYVFLSLFQDQVVRYYEYRTLLSDISRRSPARYVADEPAAQWAGTTRPFRNMTNAEPLQARATSFAHAAA